MLIQAKIKIFDIGRLIYEYYFKLVGGAISESGAKEKARWKIDRDSR